jgi:hypothetical protein
MKDINLFEGLSAAGFTLQHANPDLAVFSGAERPRHTPDSTIERYALAEQHRAPLRDIGKGYTPSEIVRITRYKAGQVVEIIERTVTQSRATERVLFKQSAAKRKGTI